MRAELIPGDKKVIANALIPSNKIIPLSPPPPLHIKLGLMKQLVKALEKEGNFFEYFCNTFPYLSKKKKLMVQDAHFIEPMNDIESRAWKSFISVIQTLLGNRKVNEYKQLVGELTQRELGL